MYNSRDMREPLQNFQSIPDSLLFYSNLVTNMLLPKAFRPLVAACRYKLEVLVTIFAQLSTSTRWSSTASRC